MLYRLILIVVLFLVVSCKKDSADFTIDNLNNGEISCFGHAGMGFKSVYPANSWPAFETCLNRGADGTEMDVQVTKDSVLVIIHNEYMEESTSCSGLIKDFNWSEINGCNIKSNFFKDSKLMSFDEFIEKVPNPKDYIYTWDCKCRVFGDAAYNKLFARTLVNTMNKYELGNNVYIENPFDDFLQNIKDLKNDAKLFILAEDFDDGLRKANARGFFGLSMHTDAVTAEQVKKAHDNNLHVTIYGIRSEKENYAAVEKSPDFMQTDDINYLLKIFGKYHNGKGLLYSLKK